MQLTYSFEIAILFVQNNISIFVVESKSPTIKAATSDAIGRLYCLLSRGLAPISLSLYFWSSSADEIRSPAIQNLATKGLFLSSMSRKS
jgi:hypothetical protein